jgi:serine/threonine protein kinase/Tol biopolymer transport system component
MTQVPEGSSARWAQIDALFDEALDRPPAEREDWLRRACEGDEKLLEKVRRLVELASSDDDLLRPEGAMAGPVWDDVVERELESSRHSGDLAPGREVGPYRVVKLIGRGGMGAVYEAEDPRLGRRVALKVLPPELSSPARRRRFEREARAIAALNHPGIVHVYSIEEAGDLRFIAMERVQGQTLRDLMPPEGLPLPRLLDIAIPLADALGSAHAGGVVHRDVKPSNVMVTRDGHVKVLDFGLAKSGPGPTLAPGLSETVTRDGHVLGTVSHMSPEQAEGREVDHRTDIFALGVTLFEMATGRLPFPGKSAASVISAIIRDPPPSVSDLNPRMPPELSRIVRRCLAKDVDRRYQSARDVRNDLEELRQQVNTGELEAAKRRSPWPVLAGVSAVAVVAVAVAFLLRQRESSPAPPLDGTFASLTSAPGLELFPSLSPDGRFLAFTGRVEDRWGIYLQRVEGQRSIHLTADSGAQDVQPAFSPDGESIAFHSSRDGGGLFLMGATGELERKLTDFGWNPTWSPDGEEIAFATKPIFETPYDRPSRSELWAVSLEGGKPRPIGGADAVQPSWSPHGHRIAYWGLVEGGSRRDIWTIPALGGEPVPVTRDDAVDWSPAWSPDGGHLYFSSDRGGSMNLWRVPIDEVSGRVLGEPERVTAPTAFAHQPTLSADGSRLAYVSSLVEQRLMRIPFEAAAGRVAGEPEVVADDLRRVAFPHVARDGETMVFTRTHPREDLLLSRVDGTGRRQLTDDAHRDRRPRFSPDGERIAFYSNRGGHYEIWTMARDGTDLRQLTEDPERRNARYPMWSPDGTHLLYSREGVTGEIIPVAAAPGSPPVQVLPDYAREGYTFVAVDWSPDGRYLAGHLRTPADERSGISLFDLEKEAYVDLVDFGWLPEWTPDGASLVFQGRLPGQARDPGLPRNEGLLILDLENGKARDLLALPGATLWYPGVSPDGRWVFFVEATARADIWMLQADSDS